MMKHNEWMTPEGTRDLLFEECTARRRVERTMAGIFEGFGYQEVATPAVEFYDVFTREGESIPPERMFKLTDLQGRLLVLRPDLTAPIARLAGTRLREAARPLRLYYNQNVYRYAGGNSGTAGEIAQMGVEFIGGGPLICDVEIVELAARSLRLACSEDFQIELCHIGYFNALVESLSADDSIREQIRELVEHKNFPALDNLLEPFEDSPACRALRRLPALFGEPSVLEEARELYSDAQADRALDSLAQIYRALEDLGLGDHLMIDLGLVNQADYYTGIIFRGYTAGAGEPVLAGGRYDDLIGVFGAGRPATGFGINLDLLCERATPPAKPMRPRAAVLVDAESSIARAFALRDRLQTEGFGAQLLLVESAKTAQVPVGFDRVFAVCGEQTREVAR